MPKNSTPCPKLSPILNTELANDRIDNINILMCTVIESCNCSLSFFILAFKSFLVGDKQGNQLLLKGTLGQEQHFLIPQQGLFICQDNIKNINTQHISLCVNVEDWSI